MSEPYEYEVYQLDRRHILKHHGRCILATNDLGIASSFIYDYYKKYGVCMAIWQPRHECYRDYYRNWDDVGDPTNGIIGAIRNFIMGCCKFTTD